MLSGCRRREDLGSAAFFQHRTDVEAAVPSCSAPMTLGALQTMLECLSVPSLNTRGSTYSRNNSTKRSYGQKLLTHGHYHKGQLSKSDSVDASSNDEMRPNFKRSPSPGSNINLQPLTDASVDSVPPSAPLAGSKQYLDDDQILQKIENKLKEFRAKMKELKKRSSSDALNCKPLSSTQGCTSVASAVTGAAVKATEKVVARAVSENERSKSSRQDPEGTQMKSAPEGTQMKSAPEGTQMKSAPEGTQMKSAPEGTQVRSAPEGTQVRSAPEGTQMESAPEGTQMKSALTEDHSTEHVRIMRETAAVHSEMEDKESSSEVLRAMSDPPLEELVKENQSFTVHHNPPSQVHVCAGTDPRSPQKDMIKKEDIEPEAVDLMLSKSPPKLLACTTKDQQPFGSASNDQTFHRVEKSKQSPSNSPAGHGNLTLNSSQTGECNNTNVKSFVADCKQVIKPEAQSEELIESEEKAVQASREMDSFPCISEEWGSLRDPKYDDISEEEVDVTPQVSPHAVTNATSEEAVPPTPEQQDSFEKVPRPKYAQATSFLQQEVHSEEDSEEESDSEEVILFATELELMDEIIVLDSSDDEEELECVSIADQHPDFPKVEEFETFESFWQFKLKQFMKNLPNPLVTRNAEPGAPTQSDPPICSGLESLPLEKAAADQVSPHCSSQKHGNAFEKATEDLGILKKFAPEQVLTHGSEDSSDTEDSLDYPSCTKSNYLTASNQVKAPSLQSNDSNGEEQGEELQASPLDSADWFPDLSQDESENEGKPTKRFVSSPTVGAQATVGLTESTEPDRSRAPPKKAKYKSRHNSENDQDGSETCSFSAEASTQLPKRQESFKSRYNQPDVGPQRPRQNSCSGQNGSTVHRAIKRKIPKTNPRSEEQVKRKRLSPDTGKQGPQNMPEKARVNATCRANAQNANLNLSKERKLHGKLVSRRSSLPNQSNGKSPEAQAFGLPAQNRSQPTPPSPPKSHNSFLNPNVNSYSTAESTPAKQALVRNWSKNHISIPKERRSSYEAESTRMVQDGKTLKQSPSKSRKRRNSQTLQTRLMKKTKLQAQTLTQAVHQKESTVQSQVTLGQGYKWKDKTRVDHIDEEWLDTMYGETFKRPHY
ncbi:uncharacterized protein LOC117379648 [Periophthalmus magnuspinnatus]|uniref:uncharacterized protein LOC117379648 n=1 Tax=Periophthalmus magnuspinnatus TaxID=409849 RepID=UPI0024372680|nr:uncharacterized protein LOC117379648 [Periophthalmus magnuspinnatus]XP_055081577.1 uncharacterized protein LOC117379648 [Periophthalmus magnuspinnatus]